MAIKRTGEGTTVIEVKLAAHTIPRILEAPTSSPFKYVQFGLEDRYNDSNRYDGNNNWRNQYPQYLIWLLDRSTTHNAIVTGKVHYITGKGFISESVTILNRLQEQDLIKHINQYESLNQILPRVIFDLELHNNICLEIIGDKGKKSWSEIYHQDTSFWRTNFDCSEFYYTQNWASFNPENNEDWKVLPAYNPNKWQPKSILYYRGYRPGMQVYAYPEYIAACSSIESDYEIANFHLNNLKNGFVGGTIISMNNGTPKAQQGQNQEEIERKLKRKFTGTDNTGKIILMFSDGKDKEPTVLHLQPNDLDKQFDVLNKSIEQKIFTGHKVTSPVLFGVMKGDGISNNKDEMKNSWELFQINYIQPKQAIVTEIFNDLFEARGLSRSLKIVPLSPIGMVTESMIEKVMTVDEIRERAGLPVLKKPENNADGTPIGIAPVEPTAPTDINLVNENIKNLTGRQHQAVLRIIKQFGSGKITMDAAKTLLRSGYGLSEDDINSLLAIKSDSVEFVNLAFSNNELINVFAEFGTPKADYQELLSKRFKFDSQEAAFKFADEVSTIEQKILQLIKKDNLITNENIAKALKIVDVQEVSDIIDRMIDEELIVKSQKADQPIRKVTSDGEDKITNPKVTSIQAMYDYKWRSEVPSSKRDTAAHPSREFCKRLMQLDRYYSRADIEQISARLGYAVFDFAGGFWNHDGQYTTPYCRHEWRLSLVRKKGGANG
ncbi:MAG: hypothetical protein WCJ33_00325 [Pseudomonadota bacterium]